MKEQIVMDILREMTAILTQEQLMRLKEVVRVQLCGYDIRKKETALMRTDQNWLNYLQMYLDGFRQNGKSTGTIEQYNLHLSRMLSYVAKNVQDIEDDDLIAYMYKYRALRKVSNRYLNNMRLVFNCFFRWLQLPQSDSAEPGGRTGTDKISAGGKKAAVPGRTRKSALCMRKGT